MSDQNPENPVEQALARIHSNCHYQWLLEEKENMMRSGFVTRKQDRNLTFWVGKVSERIRNDTAPRNEQDICLKPRGSSLPSLVIASGWTDAYEMMLSDMRFWMRSGNGGVRKVFLLKWSKSPSNEIGCDLEVYEWKESTGTEYLLHQWVVLPESEDTEGLQEVPVLFSEIFGTRFLDVDPESGYMFSLDRLRDIAKIIIGGDGYSLRAAASDRKATEEALLPADAPYSHPKDEPPVQVSPTKTGADDPVPQDLDSEKDLDKPTNEDTEPGLPCPRTNLAEPSEPLTLSGRNLDNPNNHNEDTPANNVGDPNISNEGNPNNTAIPDPDNVNGTSPFDSPNPHAGTNICDAVPFYGLDYKSPKGAIPPLGPSHVSKSPQAINFADDIEGVGSMDNPDAGSESLEGMSLSQTQLQDLERPETAKELDFISNPETERSVQRESSPEHEHRVDSGLNGEPSFDGSVRNENGAGAHGEDVDGVGHFAKSLHLTDNALGICFDPSQKPTTYGGPSENSVSGSDVFDSDSNSLIGEHSGNESTTSLEEESIPQAMADVQRKESPVGIMSLFSSFLGKQNPPKPPMTQTQGSGAGNQALDSNKGSQKMAPTIKKPGSRSPRNPDGRKVSWEDIVPKNDIENSDKGGSGTPEPCDSPKESPPSENSPPLLSETYQAHQSVPAVRSVHGWTSEETEYRESSVANAPFKKKAPNPVNAVSPAASPVFTHLSQSWFDTRGKPSFATGPVRTGPQTPAIGPLGEYSNTRSPITGQSPRAEAVPPRQSRRTSTIRPATSRGILSPATPHGGGLARRGHPVGANSAPSPSQPSASARIVQEKRYASIIQEEREDFSQNLDDWPDRISAAKFLQLETLIKEFAFKHFSQLPTNLGIFESSASLDQLPCPLEFLCTSPLGRRLRIAAVQNIICRHLVKNIFSAVAPSLCSDMGAIAGELMRLDPSKQALWQALTLEALEVLPQYQMATTKLRQKTVNEVLVNIGPLSTSPAATLTASLQDLVRFAQETWAPTFKSKTQTIPEVNVENGMPDFEIDLSDSLVRNTAGFEAGSANQPVLCLFPAIYQIVSGRDVLVAPGRALFSDIYHSVETELQAKLNTRSPDQRYARRESFASMGPPVLNHRRHSYAPPQSSPEPWSTRCSSHEQFWPDQWCSHPRGPEDETIDFWDVLFRLRFHDQEVVRHERGGRMGWETHSERRTPHTDRGNPFGGRGSFSLPRREPVDRKGESHYSRRESVHYGQGHNSRRRESYYGGRRESLGGRRI